MRYEIAKVYLAFFGIVTSVFGALYIVLAVTGKEVLTDFLIASGSMWSLWKGFILFSAGVFMLNGSLNLRNIHGLGKTVLGVVMLWILAGSNILARIAASIPGEEAWFNTLSDFLASYGPPYEPELWLLPFSLAVIYLLIAES